MLDVFNSCQFVFLVHASHQGISFFYPHSPLILEESRVLT